MNAMTDRYLWLMKQALTDNLRVDNEHANMTVPEFAKLHRKSWQAYGGVLRALLRPFGLVPMKPSSLSVEQRRKQREGGEDWPQLGETMVGLKRLDHLQSLLETILHEQIPGDILEAGVWRGGASIFMQAVLKAHDAQDRTVWLCDSFEGLPPPDPNVPQDAGSKFHKFNVLAVSEETVRNNFARYDLLDDNLRFVKGYFENTLATVPVEQLALLRMDGDMYSSTMSILDALYDKVMPGGFIVIDDFAIDVCREAVHDFRERHAITEPIEAIDDIASFWRKGPAA